MHDNGCSCYQPGSLYTKNMPAYRYRNPHHKGIGIPIINLRWSDTVSSLLWESLYQWDNVLFVNRGPGLVSATGKCKYQHILQQEVCPLFPSINMMRYIITCLWLTIHNPKNCYEKNPHLYIYWFSTSSSVSSLSMMDSLVTFSIPQTAELPSLCAVLYGNVQCDAIRNGIISQGKDEQNLTKGSQWNEYILCKWSKYSLSRNTSQWHCFVI